MLEKNPTICPDCLRQKFYKYRWGGKCKHCGYVDYLVMDCGLLRVYRIEKLNYSAEGLAISIGKSQAQVYAYERAVQLPSLEAFRDLCLALKLSPEEVYDLLQLRKRSGSRSE